MIDDKVIEDLKEVLERALPETAKGNTDSLNAMDKDQCDDFDKFRMLIWSAADHMKGMRALKNSS